MSKPTVLLDQQHTAFVQELMDSKLTMGQLAEFEELAAVPLAEMQDNVINAENEMRGVLVHYGFQTDDGEGNIALQNKCHNMIIDALIRELVGMRI